MQMGIFHLVSGSMVNLKVNHEMVNIKTWGAVLSVPLC